MADPQHDRDESKLGPPAALVVGYVATGVWIVCLAIYARWLASESILQLKPNEVGDFAAGAAAPLAFLWLVVAVFLQKDELRLQWRELKQSKEALEVQAQETAKLVEQTARSVELTIEQNRRQGRTEESRRIERMIEGLATHVCLASGRIICEYSDGSSLQPLGSQLRIAGVESVFDEMSIGLYDWEQRSARDDSGTLAGDKHDIQERVVAISIMMQRISQALRSASDLEASETAATLGLHVIGVRFSKFSQWVTLKCVDAAYPTFRLPDELDGLDGPSGD